MIHYYKSIYYTVDNTPKGLSIKCDTRDALLDTLRYYGLSDSLANFAHCDIEETFGTMKHGQNNYQSWSVNVYAWEER